MDSNLKLKILGLATIGLATTSLLYYLKETNSSKNFNIYELLNEFTQMINQRFQGKSSYEMAKLILNNDEFLKYLLDQTSKIIQYEKIKDSLSNNILIQQLLVSNKEINQLLEVSWITQYLRRNSFRNVEIEIIEKLASQRIILKQQDYVIKYDSQNFMNFISISFIQIIQELEESLFNLKNLELLVSINYFIGCLIDFLDQLLQQYPQLTNLIAKVLLNNISHQIKLNINYEFLHDCADYNYSKTVKACEPNNNCQCNIFSLLCRYSSLLRKEIQEKIYLFIKKRQIFQTKEHLLELGRLLLQNTFYLCGSLSEECLTLADTFCSFHNFLIEATSCKEIQIELYQSKETSIQFMFFEHVICQHNPQFLKRFIAGLIDNYVKIFPLLSNNIRIENDSQENISILCRDQLSLTSIIGICFHLETRETINLLQKSKDQSVLEWFSQNIDIILQAQLLESIQIQFLTELIRKWCKQNSIFVPYMFGLRSSLEKKILDQQKRIKNLDVNLGITKMIGYLIFVKLDYLINKSTLLQALEPFKFVSDDERNHIFSNILKSLFTFPAMDLNYLRYVSTKCQSISQESIINFNAYYANILSSQTISLDTYMFSMQLSIIFGSVNQLLIEVGQRFLQDLKEYDKFKDCILRELILIVDLMENPIYCSNIQSLNLNNQQQQQQQQQQQSRQNYIRKTAISLWQLNPLKTTKELLLDSLQLFIKVESLDQYILDLFIIQENGTLKLKEQYEQLWPFMSLQRDMQTVLLFLQLTADEVLFQELLNEKQNPQFEFLFNVRESFFQSDNFIQIIYQLLFSVFRINLKVWIGKILFYAMEFRHIANVDNLLKSKECQSFIKEMPNNYCKYMLQI